MKANSLQFVVTIVLNDTGAKKFISFMLQFKEKSNSKFTKEEKQWLITNCFNMTATQARRAFGRHYGIQNHHAVPDRRRFGVLLKGFQKTGCISPAVSEGRPRSVRTEENLAEVEEFFTNQSHASQREAAGILQISKSSVQRIIKDLHWYPYRPKLVTALSGMYCMGCPEVDGPKSKFSL